MTTPWTKGQTVAINRNKIAVIDRVTPAGRAVIGTTIYNEDGWERGRGQSLPRRIEALTPEIETEMALKKRGHEAASNLLKFAGDMTSLATRCSGRFGSHAAPSVVAVELAEQIVAAMWELMEMGKPRRQPQ